MPSEAISGLSRIPGADRFEVVHVGRKKYLATTFPFEPCHEDPKDDADDISAAVKGWQRDVGANFPVEISATPFEGHVVTLEEGNWLYFYQEIPPEVNLDIAVSAAVELTEYLVTPVEGN
jgi:hypothetical protein